MIFNPKVIEITTLYEKYEAVEITLGELHDGIDAILRGERIDELDRVEWDGDKTTPFIILPAENIGVPISERLAQLKENK